MNKFTQHFSSDRLSTYSSWAGDDIDSVMCLYVWNIATSGAFYGSLQVLEVILRNSMHDALSNCYGHEWYDNSELCLNRRSMENIADAKFHASSGRGGKPKNKFSSPDVVAKLNFGFWVSLLSSGGKGYDYKKTLWIPALSTAFPHLKSPTQGKVQKPLEYLREFRNNIAHHERIFHRHLQQDYERILEVISWISPEMKKWVESNSRIPELLSLQAADKTILPIANLPRF